MKIARLGSIAVVLCIATLSTYAADSWPQFRGAADSLSSTTAKLPTTWNAKDGTNVAWKVELPGRGPASPIVVGSKVIVTASSGSGQDRLHVLAYDAASGKQLWHRQYWATGRCLSHPQSANAAPTPASDGERIFAFYSSNDLACLDLDGNLLWYRGLAFDYPKAGNDVGMSASPLVVGDTVIVQIENQGDSFAAGLDTATGETRWRIDRTPGANWCSPTLLPTENGTGLVLLQSPKHLTAHEPRTGKLVWQYQAECQAIPSPAARPGRVFVPAGGLTALDVSADSPAAKLAWQQNKLGPGAASPVLHEGRLYTINRAPVLTCASAETGEILWQQRLKGAFWATPVIAGNHLYAVNFDGSCLVVELDDKKGTLVATNDFGEALQGSPAVAGNSLFIRSDRHLWKITSSNP